VSHIKTVELVALVFQGTEHCSTHMAGRRQSESFDASGNRSSHLSDCIYVMPAYTSHEMWVVHSRPIAWRLIVATLNAKMYEFQYPNFPLMPLFEVGLDDLTPQHTTT